MPPAQPLVPVPSPAAELLDLELELGCAVPDPLPTHETPKPSRAGGPGGVAGEGDGSPPAAGLILPQVCAHRPPQPQSRTLCPLALLVLAFVLVWFVAWVGLCVFPPRVLVTGSTLGDASGVFLVPMLALLSFALDRMCQCVWTFV